MSALLVSALNQRRRRAGFTLIEMIVATVLLALGVVAALACISSATRSTSIASEYTTASLLVQQRFAELESQPDQIQGGEQNGTFDQEPGFRWEQTIETTPASSLFKVTLMIQWRSGNIPRSAQFVTYVQKPPEQTQ